MSIDTIKRRLREGRFPNATRGIGRGNRSQPWLIPAADLVDAGFAPAETVLVASGVGTASDGDVRLQLARLEGLLLARDAHLQELRAEVRRQHELLATSSSALAATARSAVEMAAGHRDPCTSGEGPDRHCSPSKEH